MAKWIAWMTAALLLIAVPALGERTVDSQSGEYYFPSEKEWTYHFTYAYPLVQGEDYAAAAINDTYQMALDEMVQLVLPMFANAESMRFDGKNEVRHSFSVGCNDDRLLSILQYRQQTQGEESPVLSIEALTFDMVGDYVGETLTLRGVTLAVGGVPNDLLDEVMPEDCPALSKIINGSSDLMAKALMPVLYQQFVQLQREGVALAGVEREDFELEFSPQSDYFVDQAGHIVFFFQPSLLTHPSFDVPQFPFTPAELEALLG